MSGFSHKPLDHDKLPIRVVQVEREKSPDGHIQCTVSRSTLDAQYTCLSYMWGEPTPCHTILMNGKRFSVRRNLSEFLDVVRGKDARVALWVDALCIDQQDIAERNHQVQLMGKIYSRAQEVLLWLGKIEELVPFVRLSRSQSMALSADDTSIARNEDKFASFNIWQYVRSEADLISKYLHDHPYWRRAWVTQEVLLARRVTVLVNDEEIALPLLISASIEKYYVPQTRPNPMLQFAEFSAEFCGASLIYLLDHFSDRKCSVPRDRVFSLLSICHNGSQFTVDYALPAATLVYQVLCHAPSSICLCTAAMVTHSSTSSDAISSMGELGEPYAYIELNLRPMRYGSGQGRCLYCISPLGYIPGDTFEYANDLSERRSSSVAAESLVDLAKFPSDQYGAFTGAHVAYDCWTTCQSFANYTLYWNKPTSPADVRTVYARIDLCPAEAWPVCMYGDGLEVIERPNRHIVRIAVHVLAKVMRWGVHLCDRAKHCQSEDSIIDAGMSPTDHTRTPRLGWSDDQGPLE